MFVYVTRYRPPGRKPLLTDADSSVATALAPDVGRGDVLTSFTDTTSKVGSCAPRTPTPSTDRQSATRRSRNGESRREVYASVHGCRRGELPCASDNLTFSPI